MDRFGENFKLVSLSAGLLEQIGSSGLAREEKDLAFRQLAASDDGRFDTGHSSHDDIADEHVGLEAFERLDSFFSAKDGSRLKTRLVEDDCEGVGYDLLVVGDQNSWF